MNKRDFVFRAERNARRRDHGLLRKNASGGLRVHAQKRPCALLPRCAALFFVFAFCGATFCACAQQDAKEDTVLAVIDGKEVDVQEGLMYLELTRRVFEAKGGDEIWAMNLAGRNAEQTASEKALESLIRTKILSRRAAGTPLEEEDKARIERGTLRLMALLGEEKQNRLGLTEEQLRKSMEESYRAYRYRQSLVFLPGGQEKQLSDRVDEEFAEYDSIDSENYLQKVGMDAIMIYTGEWVNNTWISYPDSQQREKLALAEEAKKKLDDGLSFWLVRSQMGEDENLTDTPLLRDRVVQSDSEKYLYRGQIQTDLAERVFRTPVGEYTDIIETRYGYIIVYVKEFPKTTSSDYLYYRQRLAEAREQYRVDLMQIMSEEQFETEYERLRKAARIEVNETVWNSAVSAYE